MKTIQSIKKPEIVLARALTSRKGRLEHDKFLLEGEKVIDWALDAGAGIEVILAETADSKALTKKYEPFGIPVHVITDGVRRKIGAANPNIKAIGIGHLQAEKYQTPEDFVLILDRLQDFGNIGTIIRSCTAFNIHHILAAEVGFDPFQRQTIAASRGTVFGMRFTRFTSPASVIEYLKKKGFQIVATSPSGTEIQGLLNLQPKPVALVVGNETSGVSEEYERAADFLVQIPMSHDVESLNVGVAAGISMYELKIKQVLSMIEKRIKATLGRELNVAGMLVQRALDASLKQVSPWSSDQVVFMMVLRCDRIMSEDKLCRQFGLLETDLESFLSPLLKEKLITRTPEFMLTPKGEEILARLWPVVEKTEQNILSSFTEEEKTGLMENLRRIQETAAGLSDNTA